MAVEENKSKRLPPECRGRQQVERLLSAARGRGQHLPRGKLDLEDAPVDVVVVDDQYRDRRQLSLIEADIGRQFRGIERHGEMKSAALPWDAFQPDASAHQVDQR